MNPKKMVTIYRQWFAVNPVIIWICESMNSEITEFDDKIDCGMNNLN